MRIAATVMLCVGLIALAGCGGGSSGSAAGGRLTFRTMWQQNDRQAAASATRRVPAVPSGFSSALPPSVQTIRIVFGADSGFACCLGIDSAQLPVDADGHSDLVLGELPSGGATLTIAGFSTDFAPAVPGISATCPVASPVGTFPCDSSRTAAPIFASDPQRVLIVPGQDNDAGDILIFAVVATPTATPPQTFPASTPTGKPTATPVVVCGQIGAPPPSGSGGVEPLTAIVRPGGSITAAARGLPAGSTLIVSPGVYAPVSFEPGDLPGGLTLLADVTGTLSESPAAPVTIKARLDSPALTVRGQTDMVIDGFNFTTGRDAGLLIQNSSGIIVRHCVLTGTRGDAIRVEHTDQSLLFDNLIYSNSAAGINLQCSSSVQAINNTLYSNRSTAIAVHQSESTVVTNNIIDSNTPLGIVVDARSVPTYEGNFNLNSDGYAAGTPIGADDINEINSPPSDLDPLFVAPTLGDFHLARGAAGSTSPAIDAGASDTAADLVDELSVRTTQTDGAPDLPPVDMGYHYLPPPPTPTS